LIESPDESRIREAILSLFLIRSDGSIESSSYRLGTEMVTMTGPLRQDKAEYPAFVLTYVSQDSLAKGERRTERALATWMSSRDPKILGIRRVEEEKDGRTLSMIHIAVPLEYKRIDLARSLGLDQIEDVQNLTRINLISSLGLDRPHSYVRIRAEVVVSRILDLISEQVEAKEMNDDTILEPRSALEEFRRTSRERLREEGIRLRLAVQHALALRNATLEPHQIQIMIHKKTGEKWVRIANVKRAKRTSLKLAIKKVGIHTAPASKQDGGGSDWADWTLHFTEREARKLFAV
jgi:hypothetical protein